MKKEAHVCVTSLKDDILLRLENRISNWNKMKRIVGMVLQYKYKLLSKAIILQITKTIFFKRLKKKSKEWFKNKDFKRKLTL